MIVATGARAATTHDAAVIATAPHRRGVSRSRRRPFGARSVNPNAMSVEAVSGRRTSTQRLFRRAAPLQCTLASLATCVPVVLLADETSGAAPFHRIRDK